MAYLRQLLVCPAGFSGNESAGNSRTLIPWNCGTSLPEVVSFQQTDKRVSFCFPLLWFVNPMMLDARDWGLAADNLIAATLSDWNPNLELTCRGVCQLATQKELPAKATRARRDSFVSIRMPCSVNAITVDDDAHPSRSIINCVALAAPLCPQICPYAERAQRPIRDFLRTTQS